ncbi:hypothetical protein [Psittacicella gerlachiana]|uniref:Uncharacterized protein n=1 Tax=Psittacicella gerlachiana TaxID=2028574 RepID=A0A3A1YHV4_9GAMM|nr:hypothetical protein [Psittacicella gerlachiana]RIY36788.1 hypothetical protein CKF59_02285 [Psittacicella gerlachiana]
MLYLDLPNVPLGRDELAEKVKDLLASNLSPAECINLYLGILNTTIKNFEVLKSKTDTELQVYVQKIIAKSKNSGSFTLNDITKITQLLQAMIKHLTEAYKLEDSEQENFKLLSEYQVDARNLAAMDQEELKDSLLYLAFNAFAQNLENLLSNYCLTSSNIAKTLTHKQKAHLEGEKSNEKLASYDLELNCPQFINFFWNYLQQKNNKINFAQSAIFRVNAKNFKLLETFYNQNYQVNLDAESKVALSVFREFNDIAQQHPEIKTWLTNFYQIQNHSLGQAFDFVIANDSKEFYEQIKNQKFSQICLFLKQNDYEVSPQKWLALLKPKGKLYLAISQTIYTTNNRSFNKHNSAKSKFFLTLLQEQLISECLFFDMINLSDSHYNYSLFTIEPSAQEAITFKNYTSLNYHNLNQQNFKELIENLEANSINNVTLTYQEIKQQENFTISPTNIFESKKIMLNNLNGVKNMAVINPAELPNIHDLFKENDLAHLYEQLFELEGDDIIGIKAKTATELQQFLLANGIFELESIQRIIRWVENKEGFIAQYSNEVFNSITERLNKFKISPVEAKTALENSLARLDDFLKNQLK